MILIGRYRSPFTRRISTTMRILNLSDKPNRYPVFVAGIDRYKGRENTR